MGGNLLSNNFVLFYMLEAYSRRLQVVIALQLKWQPQFTSVDPIVRALSPTNSNSLPICSLAASVLVPTRFTPTVPGYATCRLIDNDVNKIDAMEASRTSIATTRTTTTEAARRRTKGKWGRERGSSKSLQTKNSFQVERPLDIKNMHMSKTIWRPTMPTYACECK